jgi:hypothetical protein
MNDCLALRIDNIFVEHLANNLLLAAIFALILPILSNNSIRPDLFRGSVTGRSLGGQY